MPLQFVGFDRQLHNIMAQLETQDTQTSLIAETQTEETALSLSFLLAKDDSPVFRASLQRMEDEVDKVSAWIETVCKALRIFLEEINKYNESSSNLAGRIVPGASFTMELVDSDLGMNTLRTFADALQCVYSFNAKLVDDLQEYFLVPFIQFSRDDLKQMKEARRAYERIAEKYDSALYKYAGLSKSKDSSSLREDAFQLYDLRKLYIKTSMDYCAKSIRFKYALDRLILDQITESMDSILEFYLSASEVYKGLKPRIDTLKKRLDDRLLFHEERMALLEDERGKLEEQLVAMFKPSSVLPTSNTAVLSNKITVEDGTPTEKEGYLFKKNIPKSPLIAPSWSRRWCYIREGKFGYMALSKQRGTVASAAPLSVLLCEARIDDKQDRRYCFEIISSKRSYLLQAESEEDLVSWLKVFECAKLAAMKVEKRDDLPKDEDAKFDIQKSFIDEDEWESASTPPIIQRKFEDLVSWLKVFECAKLAAMKVEKRDDIPKDDDAKFDIQKSFIDEDEWESASTPPIIQRKFVRIASRRSESMNVERIKYPSLSYEKKNRELREVFKNFPQEDQYVDSFTASLLRESLIQGRLYLTQFHICFFSNILSLLTTVVIAFQDIKSIQRKSEVKDGIIVITTKDANYEFKFNPKNETRAFGAMNSILWSAQGEKSLSLQELFDQVYNTYGEKEDEDQAVSVSGSPSKPIGNQKSDSPLKNQISDASVPEDVILPNSEFIADTEHYERMEVNIILNCSAKKLFQVLYESGDFILSVHNARGDKDTVVTPWSKDDPPQREVKWTFGVNHPMVKAKTAECIEKNSLVKKQEHLCYIVDASSRTPAMPYGDSFATNTKFCITFVSEKTSRLQVSIGVTWFKNPLVKSIIKSEAMKGLAAYLQDYVRILHQEVAKITGEPIPPVTVTNLPKVPSVTPLSSHQPSSVPSENGISWYITMLLFALSILLNLYSMYTGGVPSIIRFGQNAEIALEKSMYDFPWLHTFNTSSHLKSSRHNEKLQSFNEFLEKHKNQQNWNSEDGKSLVHKLDKLNKNTKELRESAIDILKNLGTLDHNSVSLAYLTWMEDQIQLCRDIANKASPEEVNSFEQKCKRLQFEMAIFLSGLDPNEVV
ncbi:hypothetical protein MP638_000108 [Amoeboaphelidium occidentale]|nr:hypothetical protein MP638_000108 [Amoeboaphelidium occidentale]